MNILCALLGADTNVTNFHRRGTQLVYIDHDAVEWALDPEQHRFDPNGIGGGVTKRFIWRQMEEGYTHPVRPEYAQLSVQNAAAGGVGAVDAEGERIKPLRQIDYENNPTNYAPKGAGELHTSAPTPVDSQTSRVQER